MLCNMNRCFTDYHIFAAWHYRVIVIEHIGIKKRQ